MALPPHILLKEHPTCNTYTFWHILKNHSTPNSLAHPQDPLFIGTSIFLTKERKNVKMNLSTTNFMAHPNHTEEMINVQLILASLTTTTCAQCGFIYRMYVCCDHLLISCL